ncbi:hypothetical protein GpartN1_g4567.t1 [Galdieria partita]|uniref:ALA-interacting subunit n=1 Tax=Galdieria partita TaxID=83374 RepID=A0A9C7URG2_9RHOD|nr:hypothetical protein GpartN1_g4567.t1 [Galdieria partita]
MTSKGSKDKTSNVPGTDPGEDVSSRVMTRSQDIGRERIPKNYLTNFKQQKLRAWQPILTPGWVISTLFLGGLVCVIIGGIILGYSNRVIRYSKRYDNIPECDVGAEVAQPNFAKTCSVSIDVTKQMKAPVFLYYKLNNFYQNHRRYVASRSDQQLHGDIVKISSLKRQCAPGPYAFNSTTNMSLDGQYYIQSAYRSNSSEINNELDSRLVIPCGLVAWSFFNDTIGVNQSITFVNSDNKFVNISFSTKGIAWNSDIDTKFRPGPDPPFSSENDDLITDEAFMVWMRVAALPNFQKLYGVIRNGSLEPGRYIFNITARYPVASFGGEKYLVLSTTTWLGGSNRFLGILYIVVGCIAIVLAVGFLLKYLFGQRAMSGKDGPIVWSRYEANDGRVHIQGTLRA